jgi:hypothetical protein
MRWRSARITAGLSPVAAIIRCGCGSFKWTTWLIWLVQSLAEIFPRTNGSSIFQERSTARHFPTCLGQTRNVKPILTPKRMLLYHLVQASPLPEEQGSHCCEIHITCGTCVVLTTHQRQKTNGIYSIRPVNQNSAPLRPGSLLADFGSRISMVGR